MVGSVSGCDAPPKVVGGPSEKICLDRPAKPLDNDPKACVDTWSARLAGAPGSNKQIADAVIAGCYDLIDKAASNFRLEDGTPVDGREIRQDYLTQFSRRALFEVARNRAGRCNIP